MKKNLTKNYIILIVLLIFTVLFTLILSKLYLSKESLVSEFYKYSNKITPKEFDSYIMENPDAIIYISNKNDLTKESFEEKFQTKLKELNLKDKIIYINKQDITEKFLNELKKNYNYNIDINKTPILLIVIDKKIQKIIYVDNNTDVDNIIDYGVFE